MSIYIHMYACMPACRLKCLIHVQAIERRISRKKRKKNEKMRSTAIKTKSFFEALSLSNRTMKNIIIVIINSHHQCSVFLYHNSNSSSNYSLSFTVSNEYIDVFSSFFFHSILNSYFPSPSNQAVLQCTPYPLNDSLSLH